MSIKFNNERKAVRRQVLLRKKLSDKNLSNERVLLILEELKEIAEFLAIK